MEQAEQNFSIDHFEEKLVSYSPVLERANQQEASASETGKNEEAERTSEKGLESNVNKTDVVLPQEKAEANILPNEAVSSESAAREKVEIHMGVKQTIDVELMAKETDQEKNAQDMNPESAQKSELNLFIGSKGSAVDQAVDMKLKGENVASGVGNKMPTKVDLMADKQQAVNVSAAESKDVASGAVTRQDGRPADKFQVLNVSVGYKDVTPEKEILEVMEDHRLTLNVTMEPKDVTSGVESKMPAEAVVQADKQQTLNASMGLKDVTSGVQSEMLTKEVGQLADKHQTLNVSMGSKDVTSGVQSEMPTKEVGQLADKHQTLNVSAGVKDIASGAMTKKIDQMASQVQMKSDTLKTDVPPISTTEMTTKEIGMQSSTENIANIGLNAKQVEIEQKNLLFKSATEKPSNPIDIEAAKVTELNSKYQASTSIFTKNPVVAESIQKEERADVGSGVMQSHPIEVERKFQVTNFDENKLLQADGKLISESSFEDEYYDNNSYDLILNDCWLRKRNGKWEFKIPVNKNPSQLYMSTQFHELENEKDIRKALYEIIKPEAQVSENEGIVEEFKLKSFATFTTTRKSYKLPVGCTVVIDFTSFGYSVGEIEMMVNDNSEIGDAIDRIDAIAGQLGFQMLSIMELAKC